MEQNLRDNYPKAKIEEPNLRFPKALMKPDIVDVDDLCYMMIFEEDSRRAQHLAESIAAGATLDRRVYRFRNKEIVKFVGKDFGGMTKIHRASKATIGLLTDNGCNLHSQGYLDLVGTVEEVSTAEGLILDSILKTYSTLAYPVILMPPTIYWDYIIIPIQKVCRVLGSYGTNLLRMEMESGTWIKIEKGAPPGWSEQQTLINVFGPQENVLKAIILITGVTYQVTDPSVAQDELWREFNEPSWQDFFDGIDAEEESKEHSGEPEKGKQQAEEGGSGGPKIEKQKSEISGRGKSEGDKKTEEEATDKKSGGLKAEEGGSGVTGKEKQEDDNVHEEVEDEKVKQQAEGGGSGGPEIKQEEDVKVADSDGKNFNNGESRSKESEGESGKKKKPKKHKKKSKGGKSEGSKQIEKGEEKDSGESEKGKLAEDGGSGVTEKEKQSEHVEEADSAKTDQDEKEGDKSKEKRQEDVGSGVTEKEDKPVNVEEADSTKTEDEKEGDKSKEKRQDVEEAESEKEKGVKKVERIQVRDKYPKAKIEVRNLCLPKVFLKPNIEPNDDLCYMTIFEEDTRRAQHLAEAIAAGAKFDRRVYRMRTKDLVKMDNRGIEAMTDIHRASKATIGILSDIESNDHGHSFIDLVGTVEEVSTAEGLILDATLKRYSTLAYPVILMPPIIYKDHIFIPLCKVVHVLGAYKTNIMRMEMESGAWIEIEEDAPLGGPGMTRLIRVSGPMDRVFKAFRLIRAVIYEPAEPSAAQEVWFQEFNEPCWRDFFYRKDEEEAQLMEYSSDWEEGDQQAEEGGSGVTEKENHQVDVKQAEEAKGESEKPLEKKSSGENLSEGFKQTEGESEKKKPKKHKKKSKGGKSEESKQIEKVEEKDSGESEKGKLAEDGGSGVPEKEKQPEHVEEVDSVKTDQDEKEGELQAEEDGSGVTEKEKQEDVHEEDEDEKGAGDNELKDKREEDVEEAESQKDKGKEMEQKLRDKYPKAKIQEPKSRLPKALLKPYGHPNDDLTYMKVFEDDLQRPKHVAEAVAAGAKFDRRVYRIRKEELVKFTGKDFQGMNEVHRASKATIGLLADVESNPHSHYYIDLVGTVEEVSAAEGFILDNTLKTYSILAYPVILMPPTIHVDHTIIPVHKVAHVLGNHDIDLLRMEMETGAWIKIEEGGSEGEKIIRVFGPQENVNKAIQLIGAVTYEPSEKEKQAEEGVTREKEKQEEEEVTEKADSGEKWEEKKSKKPSRSKKNISGIRTYLRKSSLQGSKGTQGVFKEPSWSQTFGHIKLDGDKQKPTKEEAKDMKYSGEPAEKGRQQAEEGGSCVTEKETLQEEDIDEDEKGKQQAEEGGSGVDLETEKLKKLIIRIKKTPDQGDKQTEESGELQSEEGEIKKKKKLIIHIIKK